MGKASSIASSLVGSSKFKQDWFGAPLVMNECTANKLRVSYARILVEVDIGQELKKDITITDAEGTHMK